MEKKRKNIKITEKFWNKELLLNESVVAFIHHLRPLVLGSLMCPDSQGTESNKRLESMECTDK